MEHFNDTFNRQFIRTERFVDREQLSAGTIDSEAFHNAPSPLQRAGQCDPRRAHPSAASFVPRLPPRDLEVPARLPDHERVEFIRLIRYDRLLRVLTAEIELPPGVIHEYVTAVLHVRPLQLMVYDRGELLERLPFTDPRLNDGLSVPAVSACCTTRCRPRSNIKSSWTRRTTWDCTSLSPPVLSVAIPA